RFDATAPAPDKASGIRSKTERARLTLAACRLSLVAAIRGRIMRKRPADRDGRPRLQRAPRRAAPARHAPAPAVENAPPRRRRSAAMELAAEVERLERELAGARAEIAVLAAHAEIDPLTDLLNRRGFERELKRALAHAK